MLAKKIKTLLIAGASLLLATQTACRWQEDCSLRSSEGCQCTTNCQCTASGDC